MAPPAKTASKILEQARKLLADEGMVKGFMKLDPNEASCGEWGRCSLGAIAEVTGDLVPRAAALTDGRVVYDVRQNPSKRYRRAVEALALAAPKKAVWRFPDCTDVVPAEQRVFEHNDDPNTTLDTVLEFFDRGILAALALEKAEARAERRTERRIRQGKPARTH